MAQKNSNQKFRGTFIFGVVIIGVVAVRGITHYWGLSNFLVFIALLVLYTVFYFISLSYLERATRVNILYFSLQSIIVFILGNLQPALDIINLLFITLSLQVIHVYSGRAAISWLGVFAALLTITMISGQGWVEGLILSLFFLAGGAMVVSYDVLYMRARENQIRSQKLLAELQDSHQKLKDSAEQVEELASARERNRLARDLHESVSQLIFSITLNTRSAQILLEKDPTKLPTQFDLLEEMTSSALSQLRSIIDQLRPPINQ
jgi:signal transduction histidine kinase